MADDKDILPDWGSSDPLVINIPYPTEEEGSGDGSPADVYVDRENPQSMGFSIK